MIVAAPLKPVSTPESDLRDLVRDGQTGAAAVPTATGGEPCRLASNPAHQHPREGRIEARGKFLWQGAHKWRLRGVTYGPFRPRGDGLPWPEPHLIDSDLERIRSLGFNTLRVYELPSADLLDACLRHGLRILAGIPWAEHIDFLNDPHWGRDARQRVTSAVDQVGGHPAVIGFLVGNEIPAPMVRWLGPRRVERFLEQLIGAARSRAPETLLAYATYPSTEYLQPGGADFLAVNVYLNEPGALDRYLRRLQVGAGDLPLVVTEFGVDAGARGDQEQAQAVRWLEGAARRHALAGTVWFSWTDEWYRGGCDIDGWSFGLVTADRQARPAARESAAVHGPAPAAPDSQAEADNWPLPEAAFACTPSVSVIVCSHNGHATLVPALQSLQRLDYPDYEVLVVDDGSEPPLQSLAGSVPGVRCLRLERCGLGRARNAGAAAARGEVLAFTDDDCLADPHWLRYLAAALADESLSAAGGPNIPPPPRNRTERLVAAAPGGPAHVMLDDLEAEHLPGCNLAVRRSAFEAVGGFRDAYWAAGDDVDFCWRLQNAGGRLGFAPGAMVWHHRRFTIGAYLRQQRGYGRAEALLALEYPLRFSRRGRARWRGTVYGAGRAHSVASVWRPRVYHGELGQGPFQRLAGGSWPRWPAAGLAGAGLVLAAMVLAIAHHPVWAAAALAQLAWTVTRARHLALATAHEGAGFRRRDRWLVTALAWWQPLARDLARWRGLLFGVRWNRVAPWQPPALARLLPAFRLRRSWWLEAWQDPVPLLAEALQQAGGSVRVADDCSRNDLRWHRGRRAAAEVAHVIEPHPGGTALVRLRVRGWLTAPTLLLAAVMGLAAGLTMAGTGVAAAAWAGLAGLTGTLAGVAWTARRRLARALDRRAKAGGWRRLPSRAGTGRRFDSQAAPDEAGG